MDPKRDRPDASPDEMEAMTDAFWDWWTDNHHELDVGLPGDLLALRSKLNAASPNACTSS